MINLVCDRCGKKISPIKDIKIPSKYVIETGYSHITDYECETVDGVEFFDLCEDCYELFLHWISNWTKFQ